MMGAPAPAVEDRSVAHPMPPASPAAAEPDDLRYPGGDHHPAYRWAFNLWIVLFLGVICVGLLNYLGTYAKRFWPGL